MKRTPKLTLEAPWRTITNRHGKPNLFGYARVSTRDQTLEAQLSRLTEAGCHKMFAEKVSGAAGKRPGWSACVDELEKGSVLVVLRVDRMGRSLSELVRSMDEIRDLGAHVRSLEESIDTSQRGGRFAFNLIAAMAEKVRDDISQNTKAGLAELKKRGVRLGRPLKLEPAKIAQLDHLRARGFSLREIARATSLGTTTVKRGLELAAHLRGDPRQLNLGSMK
jgi:DNA invertase Pin-like site-specific DNA recombinase